MNINTIKQRWQQIQHEEVLTLSKDFIHTVHRARQQKNLDIPAPFAKAYKDVRFNTIIQPSIADVLLESLDYSNGPELKDLLSIFLEAITQKNPQALALLEHMAQTYAHFSVHTE